MNSIKILSWLLVLLFFCPLGASASFSGGDGSSVAPYLISTPEELKSLAQYCGDANRDVHFALANDIDLGSSFEWEPIGSYPAEGDFSGAFKGALDGRGHKITGLGISSATAAGLFAAVDQAAILDLRIEGVSIAQSVKKVSSAGGLAAHSRGSRFQYCSVQGSVSSAYQAGGLVGQDHGSSVFEYCDVDISVSSSFFSGGFIARGLKGSIFRHCRSAGKVSVSHDSAFNDPYSGYAGGFIGFVIEKDSAPRSEFNKCVSSALIECRHGEQVFFLGGFAGMMVSSDATDCIASGVVKTTASSSSYLGGFSGESLYSNYVNCAARGDVSAYGGFDQMIAGGFVSRNYKGGFDNCYASGAVSSQLINSTTGECIAGGFIGYNDKGGSITNCYSSGDIIAKSQKSSYIFAGGIAGYDTEGCYTGCIALGNITGENQEPVVDVYLGGICGYANNSVFAKNGICSASVITGAFQEITMAFDASNKNGERIANPLSADEWTNRGFQFGESEAAPWMEREGILSPSLYFEANLDWDNSFTVSPLTILVRKGDSLNLLVSVKSPADWAASSLQDWIAVDTPTGEKGEAFLSLTLTRNSSSSTRSGSVSVVSGGRIRDVGITQEKDRTPFEDWQGGNGLSGDPENSTSGDGLSDLEKYAMGLDPAQKHASPGVPKVKDGVFSITYPLNPDASDITVVGERLQDPERPELGWTADLVETRSEDSELVVTSGISLEDAPLQIMRVRIFLAGQQANSNESPVSFTAPCLASRSFLPAGKNTWLHEVAMVPYAYAASIKEGEVSLALVNKTGNGIVLEDGDMDFANVLLTRTSYRLEVSFGKAGTANFLLNPSAWKNLSRDEWTISGSSVKFEEPKLAALLKKTSLTPTFIRIRKAMTLADTLGENNEVGLKAGSSLAADSVFLHTEGIYKKVYYSGSQWKGVGTPSTVAIAKLPVMPHKPVQLQRKKGVGAELILAGEILMTPQIIILNGREETISTNLPVPQCLRTTNLEQSFPLGSASPGNSDGVLLPEPDPGLKYYYYDGAWRCGSNNGDDKGETRVDGVMTIYLRSTPEPENPVIISPVLTPESSTTNQ